MKLPFRCLVLGIAILPVGLTGCSVEQHPAYSPGIRYGVRTDPIMIGAAKDLGEERYDADRPGVFPLMKISDMQQPEHPYYAKKKDIDHKLLRDPTQIPADKKKELEDALETMFGTPAKPIVNAKEAGLDAKLIEELKLDDATLAMGSTRYRIHCLHCHGVPGDGRGPTARWINPHPRDFRAGKFKFQSVDQASDGSIRPPSRADLLRTVRQGLEGTAMPSFNLLRDDELEALVSYVIHLSIRGSTEFTIIKENFNFDKDKNSLVWGGEQPKAKDAVKDYTEFYAGKWHASNSADVAIKVAPYPYDENAPDYLTKVLPASVKRGKEIFTAMPSDEFKAEIVQKTLPAMLKAAYAAKGDAKLTQKEMDEIKAATTQLADDKARDLIKAANCVSCHNNFGRQALYRFDEWGTLVRPNNLTTGNLRGGKRPVDIYYRIHSGINGSGMTPFGKTYAGNEQYLWDVVNFVSVLPYPAMRDKLGLRID